MRIRVRVRDDGTVANGTSIDNLAVSTLKEFVDYARKNPGKVTYATMGIGSPMHLAMEYIAKKDGINWVHVPYPGTAPALTALLGGHVTADSGSGGSGTAELGRADECPHLARVREP